MNKLLFKAIEAAVLAGEKIIETKEKGFDVTKKADESPVTMADLASNKVIQDILIPTNIPVLSEESKILDYNERKTWTQAWIVDPLDGTKEFIANRSEYTTNIGLYDNGEIVLGAVYVPELKTLYFAAKQVGSYLCKDISSTGISGLDELITKSQKLPLATSDDTKFVVVASRSHLSKETEDYIEKLREFHPKLEMESYGSSLKLCKVAEGIAKVYPRLGPTMEWDVAASVAIVKYAGLEILKYPEYLQMEFNKENLLNPYFVVFDTKYKNEVLKC